MSSKPIEVRIRPEVHKMLNKVKGIKLQQNNKFVSFSDVIKEALVAWGVTEEQEDSKKNE